MDNKSIKVTSTFGQSSPTSGGGQTGLLDLLDDREEEKKDEKKKSHPLLEGLGLIPRSVATGVTKELDSVADAPFSLAATQKAKRAEKTGNATDEFIARQSKVAYNEAADNHILGQWAENFENKTAAKQQKILEDNPDSKMANIAYKGTQLAESAGRMIPGIAISAGVGALAGAGEAAAAVKAAEGVDKALGTVASAEALTAAKGAFNSIARVAENAGLASMWLGVYDASVDEAIEQGWDMASAGDKAFVDASLEVATEKLFGGIAGLRQGEGLVGKAVQKVSEVPAIKTLRTAMGDTVVGQAVANISAKYVKLVEKNPRFFANWTGQTVVDGALQGEFSGYLGEAVEEMISEFFGPRLERRATGKTEEEIPDSDLGQVLEAGLGGALLSAFMSPIGKIRDAAQARIQQEQNDSAWAPAPEVEEQLGLPGREAQLVLPEAEPQLLLTVEDRQPSLMLPTPGVDAYRASNEYKVRLANAIILDGWGTVAEDTEAISSFIGYENAKQFNKIGALDEDLRSRIDLLEYKPGITTDVEVEEFLTKFSGLYKEQMLRNMRNYKTLDPDVTEIIVSRDKSVIAARNALNDFTGKWNDAARSLGFDPETMSNGQKQKVAAAVGVKAYALEFRALEANLKEALALASNEGRIEQLLRKANRDGTLESTYGEYVANEYHKFISDTEYAVITNEDGSQVSMNRDQYAAANYHGMDYAQISGIGTYDLANEVEQVFNEYYEERRKKTYDPELRRQILDTVNRDLADSGITDLKINFDESLIGTPTPARYRLKEGIIDLDPSVADSVSKARFFIAHEAVHRAYSNLADNPTALDTFKRQMRAAMAASGHTYDEWYKAYDSLYRKYYFNQSVQELIKRDPSISKEKLLESAKKRTDYIMTELGNLAEEETFAKFSSYMFSSNGFAYSLASTNKEALATAKALVDQSVLKDSPFRDFAAAQEQVSQLMADAINRDVSAVENIFTEKENISIRRPHPDYFYGEVNESDRRYSKMLRVAEGKLTDNVLKSLKTGEKLENFLLSNGVTAAELEEVGVSDYFDENPNATAEDILAYISAAETQLTRVIRTGDDTYYDEKSSRAERGYRNYREIEYQYPVTGEGSYSGNHYDAETVFHARVTDALTKDGKRFLFIDEMQSDPHNAAVKAGRALGTKKPFYFTDGAESQIEARLSELRGERKENRRRLTTEKLSRADKRALEDRQWKLSEQINNLESVPSSGTPYKKGWLKYVLRDLCDLAVAEGYDGIAWISPEKTRDRYYPKRIRYTSNEAKQSLKAYKIEYGQEVPKFFNAVSKRWGTSIESILFQVFPGEAYIDEEISTGDFYSSPDIAGGEAQDNYAGFGNLAEYEMSKKYGGQVYVDFLANFHKGKQNANGDYTWDALVFDEETDDPLGEFKVTSNFPTLDKAENRSRRFQGIYLTDAMRTDISENGQERFNISFSDGYEMPDSIAQLYEEADGVLDAETQALYEEAYGGQNTENPSDVLFKNSTPLDSEFQKLYEETGQKYGTMKDTDIPNQVTDTDRVSKFTRNVATDPTITPQMSDELKRIVMEGATSYTPLTDRASEAAAQRRLKRYETTDAQGRIAMDYFRAVDDYMENSRNGKNNTKTDVASGELLLRNIGSQIAMQGDNVDPGLLNLWSKMVGALSVDATRAGQTTQAFSMLKKLTPEGRLYYIQRSIDTLKESLENAKMDILGSAKKQAKALEGYEIPEELLKALSSAQTAQELDAVEQRIVDDIVGQIPPTLVTRAVAWRYLAMLGNVRTHERNCISNAANLVATGIANRLSGVAQDIFLKDNAEHTATRTKASAEVKEFAKNDWETCMQIIYEQGGKTTGFDTKIEQGMRNFGRNAVGDKMEGLYNFNNKWLTKEDSFFGGLAFRRAMENYITANHIDIAQFSGEAGRSKASLELLGKIRSYAMQEANRATYHEANALATALNKLEKESPLGALLVGGIAPFKKTPLNVLKQGAMYTGGGIIKGAYQLMNQVPSGQVTAAEAISNICTGMTGTMLIALGMFLKGAGMLKGGGSDDDREEYYDEMVGYQKYSITIGDRNYTIDWLTPVSMPLFAGVSVMEAMERLEADGDEQAASVVFTDMLGALGTAFDPLTNLSLLSGINDAMSSYSNNNKLMQLGLSAAESYATQFIPTLAGQVARTIDPTRRTTYAPKDSEYWGGTEAEKFVNRLKSKIPGLSYQNEAYIDMWGREENRSDNVLARAVDQILVPWYSKTVQATEVDDQLAEVFAEAKTSTVLPATPNSYYTIDGETYYMSAEDYTTVKQLVGQLSYTGVKSLFDSTLFDRIGTDRRVDVISDVYTFSRAYAKAAYAEKNGIPLKVDSSIGKVQAALDSGLTIGDYFIIKKLIGEFTADKGEDGKSISGSKKKKQVNLLNELGLSAEQQKVFFE